MLRFTPDQEIQLSNINRTRNGLAVYKFFYKKTSKNSWHLITKYEYIQGLNSGARVSAANHMGIKTNITDDLSTVTLFSSKINEMTFNIESAVFKGINKLLFLDNKVMSAYYESSYRVKDFPKYAKNFILEKNNQNQNGIKLLAEEAFRLYQKSYYNTLALNNNRININSPDTDCPTDLIYVLKSQFSAHYVEFTYKNTMICSSLGVIPKGISAMFLHTLNKNSKLNIHDILNIQGHNIIKQNQLVREPMIHTNREVIECYNNNLHRGTIVNGRLVLDNGEKILRQIIEYDTVLRGNGNQMIAGWLTSIIP